MKNTDILPFLMVSMFLSHILGLLKHSLVG